MIGLPSSYYKDAPCSLFKICVKNDGFAKFNSSAICDIVISKLLSIDLADTIAISSIHSLEKQEILDYSIANNIYHEVEIIPILKLDEAYQEILDGEVKFRYMIDMSSIK